MQTQYNVYRTYLYFHDYSVAIEIDENGHSDRSIVYGMKKGKAIEQELVVNSLELILKKNNF